LIQVLFLVPPQWFMGGPIRPLLPKAAFWSQEHRWPKPVAGLLAALAVVWVTRFEWYPITDMHMYTRVDTKGAIRYPQIVAHLASGKQVEERPEKVIKAMRDARYRHLLEISKKEEFEPVAREFFEKCGHLHNAHHTKDDPIVAFEVVWMRWDFTKSEQAVSRGKASRRFRYDLGAPATAHPKVSGEADSE
jgi:hypothetical protein